MRSFFQIFGKLIKIHSTLLRRGLNIYNKYQVSSGLVGGACSVCCGYLFREVDSGNFFFELCGRVALLLCVEVEVENLNREQFSNTSVLQVFDLTLIGL